LRYVKGKDDLVEDENHIEMDPYDLTHPTFTHHVTCPCAKFNIAKLMKRINCSALSANDKLNIHMPT